MRKTVIGFGLSAMLHALCLPVWAQQPKKIARIGVLSGAPASAMFTSVESLRQGLRELGYVEGQNIV